MATPLFSPTSRVGNACWLNSAKTSSMYSAPSMPKARAGFIVTPVRHVETMGHLEDEELYCLWRVGVRALRSEGPQPVSMVVNHGSYRNLPHLHLKIWVDDGAHRQARLKWSDDKKRVWARLERLTSSSLPKKRALCRGFESQFHFSREVRNFISKPLILKPLNSLQIHACISYWFWFWLLSQGIRCSVYETDFLLFQVPSSEHNWFYSGDQIITILNVKTILNCNPVCYLLIEWDDETIWALVEHDWLVLHIYNYVWFIEFVSCKPRVAQECVCYLQTIIFKHVYVVCLLGV